MYIVCYDIEDDRIRSRIAKILEGWGRRVQYSVFECDIDATAMDRLADRLAKALSSPENGGIRIYCLCGRCLRGSFGLGGVLPPDDAPCIVR